MLSQLVCKRSCFDGSPFSGRALVKEVHYSGRPQVHTTYACGFTANKVQIKRSLNLLTVNTMCTNDLRKSQTSTPSPRPQPPIPTLIFFSLLCLWSYSMWEVRNDTWRFMVAYHFCIDQISLFFYKYIWSLQHVADVRWYRTYVLVAYHFCIDHWTSSPLFGTIIYRIYYNII